MSQGGLSVQGLSTASSVKRKGVFCEGDIETSFTLSKNSSGVL